MDIGLIIILIVAIVIVAMLWGNYNALVKLDERVKEAWSDITVQLKRRSDLIPNLVESVKGYTKHEEETLKAISDARAAMAGAKTVDATAKADKEFNSALSRLMVVAESYPELKADKNFQQLSSELSDTEDKIQAARRFYNNGAREMNTKIKQFPTNLLNGMFHFTKYDYYEVDEAEKETIQKAPEVKF